MMNPKRCFTRPVAAVWLMLLIWSLSGCQSESAEDPAPGFDRPRGTIAAMGDSLTAGYGLDETQAWPALLEKKLEAAGYQFRVVNAGISGETSSGALSRTDWVLKLKPDIVILETGANDGMRGIDPDLVQSNISRIVQKLKQEGVVVVLAGMRMFGNLGRNYVSRFESIYPSVAEEQNVLLIPFILKGVAARPGLNLSDGIHPNAAGHRIIADLVYPYAVEAIKRHAAAVDR